MANSLILLLFIGGRCAIRTRGLWFRRPTLYPTELIAPVGWLFETENLPSDKDGQFGRALFGIFPVICQGHILSGTGSSSGNTR